MEILWLGRSCFHLQTGSQSGSLRILTDPFDLPGDSRPPSDTGVANLLDTPDIVTVSRRSARERLVTLAAYRVIDGPGEYEIKGVPVTGIATAVAGSRLPATGEPPTVGVSECNVVYTFGLDGVTVCHLGRLDHPLSAPQLQEIGTPQVLLVLVGETGGLPVPRAVELANQLEARLLVPMTLGGAADEGAVERFCRELGADAANFASRLTVTASGLPAHVQIARLTPITLPGPRRDPPVPELA